MSDAVQRGFGVRLRRCRKEQNKKQLALTTALDLSRTSISNIECGKHRVFLDQVYAAAYELGVPLTALLPPVEDVFLELDVTVAPDDPMSAKTQAIVAEVAASVPNRIPSSPTRFRKKK